MTEYFTNLLLILSAKHLERKQAVANALRDAAEAAAREAEKIRAEAEEAERLRRVREAEETKALQARQHEEELQVRVIDVFFFEFVTEFSTYFINILFVCTARA